MDLDESQEAAPSKSSSHQQPPDRPSSDPAVQSASDPSGQIQADEKAAASSDGQARDAGVSEEVRDDSDGKNVPDDSDGRNVEQKRQVITEAIIMVPKKGHRECACVSHVHTFV